MSFNLDMLDVLACIDCGGSIEYIEKTDKLRCKSCLKEYEIINGIPMMGGKDDRVDDPEVYK